jgi:phospholipid/cholesterol/gamma-HCH transport system ATP-binding protein
MSDAEPRILELDQATSESSAAYDTGMFNFTLSLSAGELVLVRLESEAVRLPLADAACGILPLESGTVRFVGEEWAAMNLHQAARQRGRIGRTFEGRSWVGNLDVDENVVLAQRHHTHRTTAELAAEASDLARQFGLPGLPRGRPDQTRRQDLQRAALVRAFLGSPILLILERPEAGIFPQIMPMLVNALRKARQRGAAILWITSQIEVWHDPGVRPTARYAVSGSQLLVADDNP